MIEQEKEPGRLEMIAEKAADVARFLERLKRLEELVKDPDVYKGFVAVLRTGINLGVTAADMIPGGVGEAASWTADGCKFLANRFDVPILDTSPDVSEAMAIGTEVAEFATGGLAPSHVVETAIQLVADRPRMKKAVERTKQLWNGEQEKLAQPEVAEAVHVFSK